MDPNGKLIAVIGDEDSVTGFVLAGLGHRNVEGTNFLIVKPDTNVEVIEEFFKTVTAREDMGIVLINQSIANNIRHLLLDYDKAIPTILEIPSKDHPYEPEKDLIMQRVSMMLGMGS